MRRLLEGDGYVKLCQWQCRVELTVLATGVEGIFRLSGSEKRIKELREIFNSPDRYGKGLAWDTFTVHDAANVLRRYLHELPEPVVPLDLYEKFRDPLQGATNQAVGDAEGPKYVDNFDEKVAIRSYQKLITELPPLNRQLTLYLLDLLAVFAAKADENRMTSYNLAAIFQPCMLTHPKHDQAPAEYRLNQCVIIFLIENQDHFLIGMQGTGTDEKTQKEIESGTPLVTPSTPNRNTGIDRSASNASAGAVSVRRDGQLRRNRSVTSKHSKEHDSTTPNSPALSATPTKGGLGRSNTVPSKKSPAVTGGKFRLHDHSPGPQSLAIVEPLTPAHTETPRHSEHSSLAPPMGGTSHPGRSHERLLDVPQEGTPSKERNVSNFFQRSPTDDSKRQPNKLKKKRIPGSLNHSAQSSSTSLQHPGSALSPAAEGFHPIDQRPSTEIEKPKTPVAHENTEVPAESTPRASHVPSANNNFSSDNNTLRARKSPSTSLNSSYNEGSDLEHGAVSHNTAGSAEPSELKEKKRRWRMSRKNDSNPGLTSPDRGINSNEHAGISTTSISSAAHKPRNSFTENSTDLIPTVGVLPQAHQSHHSHHNSQSQDFGKENKDESKGPIGWIRNKMREKKEIAEHRRNKSPPAEHTHSPMVVREGRSLDIKREHQEKERSIFQPVGTLVEQQSLEEEKEMPPTAQPPVVATVPAPVVLPVTGPVAAPSPASIQPAPTMAPEAGNSEL